MKRQAASARASGTTGTAQRLPPARRSTPQRRAVRRYLASVHHHPTAEDVYVAVRQELPRVSLATVYSALELLVRSGLGTKLTYGDAAARYDIRTDAHSHTRCLRCGRVRDVEVAPDPGWLSKLRAPGFRSEGIRLEVIGRCTDCRTVTAPRANPRRRRGTLKRC